MKIRYYTEAKFTPTFVDVLKGAKRYAFGDAEVEFEQVDQPDAGVLCFGTGLVGHLMPTAKILTMSADGLSLLVRGLKIAAGTIPLPAPKQARVIESVAELDALGEHIVVDIETRGDIDGPRADLELLCIGIWDGSDKPVMLVPADLCASKELGEFLTSRKIICHNSAFDVAVLNALLGTRLRPNADTMVLHYAMHPASKSHGLKDLARYYLGVDDWDHDLEQYTGKGKSKDYGKIPKDILYRYCALDVYYTGLLLVALTEEATEESKRFYGQRMKDNNLLIEIEEGPGVFIDVPYFERLYDNMQADLDSLRSKTAQITGIQTFNPGSHVQVKAYLASAGIEVKNTEAKELEKFKGDSFIDALLEYKKTLKMRGFVKTFLEKNVNGYLRPQFKIARTTTGRLASCVAADTLIDMPRDMTKYPHGVPISEVKEGDWVYSFDMDMELTLRQVEWVGPTKVDRTVDITFENSEGDQTFLRCTPDHLVRLYNGDWRHAAYLLKNTAGYGEGYRSARVLGMVRRSWKNPLGENDNYIRFFPHSNSRHTPPSISPGHRYGSSSGGVNMEHRWVMERVLGKRLSTKFDVNHIDGNKVNNHPSNLEYISRSQHRSQTRHDGTFGKEQHWTETHMGKTDWRVVQIQEGPVVEVWDMTIPEDHQFIANGIVVHNSNPNIQQIPREGPVKRGIIAPPGYKIVTADYSQVELRVMAVLSGDKEMQSRFQPDSEDFFDALMPAAFPDLFPTLDAYGAYKAEHGGKDKVYRTVVKQIIYGLSYARGAAAIAESIGQDRDYAQGIIDNIFAAYPQWGQWRETIKEQAVKGELTAWTGMPFEAEIVHWRNRAELERSGLSFMPQHHANQLMLNGARRVHESLNGRGWIHAIVHDAAYLYVKEEHAEEVACELEAALVESGREFFGDAVVFAAGPEIGNNWEEV